MFHIAFVSQTVYTVLNFNASSLLSFSYYVLFLILPDFFFGRVLTMPRDAVIEFCCLVEEICNNSLFTSCKVISLLVAFMQYLMYLCTVVPPTVSYFQDHLCTVTATSFNNFLVFIHEIKLTWLDLT